MDNEAQICTGGVAREGVFPLWGMMSGIVIGFFSGLGFVAWWFGPEDFTHSMALIHEGAGAILGGLMGVIIGLAYKMIRLQKSNRGNTGNIVSTDFAD